MLWIGIGIGIVIGEFTLLFWMALTTRNKPIGRWTGNHDSQE
ncbi:hypothetical protein [Paenibacillus wynnii]|nr:hypothetical protein [Paenibacillus wynnii]